MLIDAIKQHGKKQIEVKQKIRITDKTKKLKYRVDTFFIFPGALQITENNFKKEVEFCLCCDSILLLFLM